MKILIPSCAVGHLEQRHLALRVDQITFVPWCLGGLNQLENKGKPGENRPEPAKKIHSAHLAFGSSCAANPARLLTLPLQVSRVALPRSRQGAFPVTPPSGTLRNSPEPHGTLLPSPGGLLTFRVLLQTVAHHCQSFPAKKMLSSQRIFSASLRLCV
jgi:hypothetical protein